MDRSKSAASHDVCINQSTEDLCVTHVMSNAKVSATPPPKKKKSFPEKHLKLFEIKIIFNNDFKESVKVTNIFRNAISANQEHYIFKSFQVSMPPDPPRRPPKHFSRRRVAEIFFFRIDPPNKKIQDRTLVTGARLHFKTIK